MKSQLFEVTCKAACHGPVLTQKRLTAWHETISAVIIVCIYIQQTIIINNTTKRPMHIL